MLTAIITVSALVLIAAAVLIAARWTYGIGFYSAPRDGSEKPLPLKELPDEEAQRRVEETINSLVKELGALPFEEIRIKSSVDGTGLYARYYHRADGAPLQIECHGYRGSALRDFCGGDKFARENGFNTLLIDERAHGKSEGNTITFGVMEKFDVRDWVDYSVSRFGSDLRIILAGISMGAATVLMASELGLPDNVKCIIADAPYCSQKEIIFKTTREMGFPPKPSYPFVKLGARIFGHFDLDSHTALDAVANTDIPILLIHGEADDFVPCDMSRRLNEKCRSKHKLYTCPGADHGLSFIVDPETYKRVTADFLREYAGIEV